MKDPTWYLASYPPWFISGLVPVTVHMIIINTSITDTVTIQTILTANNYLYDIMWCYEQQTVVQTTNWPWHVWKHYQPQNLTVRWYGDFTMGKPKQDPVLNNHMAIHMHTHKTWSYTS